jgi:FtsP/CotA-like multicopper oxidase with cupredoxin domain
MTRADAPVSATSGPPVGTGLTKFADPLRIPPRLRPSGFPISTVTVEMRNTEQRLHSQLPKTPLWTYNGHFPGPTIEVRRGQRVRVAWTNLLHGPHPVVHVEILSPPPVLPGPFPQPGNTPGREGVAPDPRVTNLPPYTAVHLHGADTNGGNDGLPENAVFRGDSQLSEYPNNQPATTLWYHDHAMDVTRFNVSAGLLGMYLIRDEEEDALGLPSGDHEVPLIFCDRNLDTDTDGRLTGRLLHKVALLDVPSRPTLPFYGPFTLVNGGIWPHLDVDARWYRFRMVNGSNARFYEMTLLDEDDNPLPGVMQQIGTDAGLLPAPVPITGELILAPAERADILVDFSAFRGRRLRLVSTGLGVTAVEPPEIPGVPDAANGNPEPDVMQFRVRNHREHDDFHLPATLSTSFTPLTHAALPADHEHRWIVLTPPVTGHPELWEMEEVVDPTTVTIPGDGIIQVQLPSPPYPADTVLTLRRVASRYDDAVNIHAHPGGWELWNFLNLGGPTHPMHIHLIRFQALLRERFDTSAYDPAVGGTATPVVPIAPGVLDPNERGWKDTIRVAGGELVSVAGQFLGGLGRFVYHCHILEHEDEGMMRPFVVMPEEAMALGSEMDMPDHGHDH